MQLQSICFTCEQCAYARARTSVIARSTRSRSAQLETTRERLLADTDLADDAGETELLGLLLVALAAELVLIAERLVRGRDGRAGNEETGAGVEELVEGETGVVDELDRAAHLLRE